MSLPKQQSELRKNASDASYKVITSLSDINKDITNRYAFRITQTIRNAMRTPDPLKDPVAAQYIPQNRELITTPEEDTDPIGDHAHMPVKGIVHRYPDRVLLKATQLCAVYCRYCFRREMIGPKSEEGLSAEELENALSYIENTPEIWEVILTGGDPLILSPARLQHILNRLEAIKHVQIIRIHSRVPIADPNRITPELCTVLNTKKPLYLALHINHAQEITEDVEKALKALRQADCILLSQSVLLKGVNDNIEALENLFRALIERRVKPYYLHHPDLARGTSHFRLSIQRGQQIMKDLHSRLSGIAIPHYMLDIPGGYGKVPLSHCYLKELENDAYEIEDRKGQSHLYPPTKDSA